MSSHKTCSRRSGSKSRRLKVISALYSQVHFKNAEKLVIHATIIQCYKDEDDLEYVAETLCIKCTTFDSAVRNFERRYQLKIETLREYFKDSKHVFFRISIVICNISTKLRNFYKSIKNFQFYSLFEHLTET